MTTKLGTLIGVGVGPGDPDLITLKALKAIDAASVLAWPAGLEGPSLARTIAEPHIKGDKIEIAIRMPMVAERFPAQQVYDDAAIEIAKHLDQGQDVVVLCEGDPFFYGSFMYLYGRMADDYPTTVIPGVSSIMATAAAVGAPLASRNDILTILPGPLDEETLYLRLRNVEAAAIIKLGKNLGKVRKVLERHDLIDCARYIEHATMDNQTVKPLADVTGDTAPYFSMILVHKRIDAWK